MSSPDMITLKDMRSSLSDYSDALEDAELSENTLIKYTRVASDLIAFLSKTHADDQEILKKDMITWKKSITNYDVKTQYDYIVCANKFTRFCVTQDLDEKEKCYLTLKNVKFLRAIQTDDDIVTPVEIKKLKQAAKKIGYDDIALSIDIFVKSGIRFDALKYFTVENLKGKNVIEVKTKGKIVKVIISRELKSELKKYIDDHDIRSGYLVTSPTDKSKPISIQTMWNRLQKIARIAKVKKGKVHPHSFRHAFAKNLYYEKHTPIAAIKDILGHESLDTTMIYLRLTTEEMKKAVDGDKSLG